MSFASLRRVLRAARKGLCATCSKTRYPQLEAAGSGHVGCLIYTIETIGSLIKDEHDVTAMHVAARKGQISILIYIIENNIIDKTDIPRAKNGATPAHDAAGTGNLDCLRYLINSTQAGPNDLDSNSATPLHWAAQSGHLNVVEWLVKDAKAPIDVVTRNGVTPFHLAAVKNHLSVLKWLVSYAFRTHPRPMKLINAKDKNGSTPIYLGAHSGNLEVIKWLTEKGGGDPSIMNRQGMAPIHGAASNGHIECVKFLYHHGQGSVPVPGSLRTTEGACALHFASAEGEIEIVQWLLSQDGCTGNERDYFQSTPLHDAAENGHLIILKALCDHGCDSSLLDVDGNTAADLARKNSHSKCAAYLDSYMKRAMWSRMNGIRKDQSQPVKSKPRSTQSKSQVADRFQTAPSRMVSSYADDEDERKQTTTDTGGGLENQWVTVRDLLEEDELIKMNEDSSNSTKVKKKSEADMKRRLFEEKLAQEQEERENKKKNAVKTKEQNKSKSQPAINKQGGATAQDREVLEALKTFDDVIGIKDLNEGMEQKGSSWISNMLRKKASSTGPTEKPTRKPRRRGSDPSEWNIPSPPPIPKVKFLLSKQKRPGQSGKGAKKDERISSNWGRDAYDDGESDESSIGGSRENINQLKTAIQMKNVAAKKNAQVKATPLSVSLSKENGGQKKGMTRKDTPRPVIMTHTTPDNLQPIPFEMDESKTEDPTHLSAPIARLGNTRNKQSRSPSPKRSGTPNTGSGVESHPIVTIAGSSQQVQHPALQRQAGSVKEGATPGYGRYDEDAESSSEEETTDSESTESESESDEEDDDGDRPIMAQNVGIHGARIAKQVMQRMKNQRYPSIFSKPIITLDTIVDVRYERPYQTDTTIQKADTLHRLHSQKKVWDAWRKNVLLAKFARMQAMKMLQRRKKALIAEIFYAWVQVKNEAEVDKAEKKQVAVRHYKTKMKGKIFKQWKELMRANKNPRNSVQQQYLDWMNTQLVKIHKHRINELIKPLADGTLIIAILANLSGSKPPRYKTNPKHDLHKADNWKVAYLFMKKVGINVKDFEPADLASLNESSILNMFSSIVKWADNQ